MLQCIWEKLKKIFTKQNLILLISLRCLTSDQCELNFSLFFLFSFFLCMSTWNSKNQYCSQLKYWFPSLPLYVVKCYQTTFILSHKNAFIRWPYTHDLISGTYSLQCWGTKVKYVRIFRRKSDFSWWWYTCNSVIVSV